MSSEKKKVGKGELMKEKIKKIALTELLRALSEIDENGPKDNLVGISHNVMLISGDDFTESMLDYLREYCQKWTDYTGVKETPVSFFTEEPAVIIEHDHAAGHWAEKTKYGRACWRMLRWVIVEIRADLEIAYLSGG